MLRTKVIRLFVALLLLVLNSSRVHAQARSGDWTRSKIGDKLLPLKIAFANEDTGIIELSSFPGLTSTELLTHDKGRSFDTINYRGTSPLDIGQLYVFGNEFIVALGTNDQILTSTDASTWASHLDLTYYRSPFSGVAPLSQSVILGLSAKTLISYDTGNTFSEHGPGPGYNPQSSAIQDSEHIMVAEYQTGSQVAFVGVYHDSGWSYVAPEDTFTKYHRSEMGPVLCGPETGHFFVLGGGVDSNAGGWGRNADYYETKDYGATWKKMDIAGGRVVRLSNPAPNFLVATVGHSRYIRFGDNAQAIVDHTDRQNGIPEKWIDSLFISTDDGATWTKDGTTFAGDTIDDMYWLPSKVGYVLSYHDSNTYLSKYAPSSSVIEHGGSYTFSPQLKIAPNPVLDNFTFTNVFAGTYGYGVTDIFGNNVMYVPGAIAKGQSVRVAIGDKPAGCYFLYVLTSLGPSARSFVKL